MVVVYFETEKPKYAEKVATFAYEELYTAVLPQLEAFAESQGFDKVTEYIE